MSNIFEIDGEIEDNDDDNRDNGGQDGGDENQSESPESDNDASLDQDDETNDSDTSSDDDTSESPGETEAMSYDASDDEDTPLSVDPEVSYGTEADYGSVEEVTEEEIEEVLAEIDESERILAEEENRFDDEAPVQEPEETPHVVDEKEESFDDIFPPGNGKKLGTTSWIFIVLFLISFTLLAYYQFYDGKSFSITFVHSSKAGMTAIDSLNGEYRQAIADNDDLRKRIEELTENVRLANARIQQLESDTSRNSNDSTGAPLTILPPEINSGTYYQVQLMALEQYGAEISTDDLGFFVDKEDGFTKMLIGAFTDEATSKELYQKLRKAGFDDAFIVKKVNGKRVPYHVDEE